MPYLNTSAIALSFLLCVSGTATHADPLLPESFQQAYDACYSKYKKSGKSSRVNKKTKKHCHQAAYEFCQLYPEKRGCGGVPADE
ncbi:MAG: hypothetical protein KTR20_08735 [Cellvibrionaceae bacterium]|nr:hypothetical protein [Cellvibrionaceae bacterium]